MSVTHLVMFGGHPHAMMREVSLSRPNYVVSMVCRGAAIFFNLHVAASRNMQTNEQTVNIRRRFKLHRCLTRTISKFMLPISTVYSSASRFEPRRLIGRLELQALFGQLANKGP